VLRKKLILTRASNSVKEGRGERGKELRGGAWRHKAKTGKVIGETRHNPNVQLAGFRLRQVQFSLEAAMQGPVVCVQCDKPEGQCNCEKYCTICKGQLNVKLCADGLYYCPDCREACDMSLASNHSER
jgi:hypothetical protein